MRVQETRRIVSVSKRRLRPTGARSFRACPERLFKPISHALDDSSMRRSTSKGSVLSSSMSVSVSSCPEARGGGGNDGEEDKNHARNRKRNRVSSP